MRIRPEPVVCLLFAALVACHHEEPESKPVAPVQVAPVIRGSIRAMVDADAVLFPREQANIVPKISAPVRRFLVNRGDHVKEGQVVAELEGRDLVGAARESRGNLVQAESNYRATTDATVPEAVTRAQADLDAARATTDAARKLLESRQQLFKEGALPRKQVDEAQVLYAQAHAQFATAEQHLQALQSVGKEEQIRSAQAQVEAAHGRADSADAQVAYASIRSPLTGVVTDRPLYPGEMATTGAPLLTVMDVSTLVARINMSQDAAADVRVGNDATVTMADGSEPISAKVTIVSPATDANSTTVQVWVQIPNPGEHLRAGQSAHVTIVKRIIDGATLVPASALLADEAGATIVKVVDDKNIAHNKGVQAGARDGDVVQVSGVEPGERVIKEGGVGLDDKAQVRIMKPGEKAAGDDDDDDEKDGK